MNLKNLLQTLFLNYGPSKVVLNMLRRTQEKRIFRPYKTSDGHHISAMKADEHNLDGVEIATLTAEDGVEITVFFKPPMEGKPTFLKFHGNTGHPLHTGRFNDEKGRELGENDPRCFHRIQEASEIISDGSGLLMITYHGYAGNAGLPSQKNLILDGEVGLKFLADNNISPSEIILFGHSLGANLATELAVILEEKGSPAAMLSINSAFTSTLDKALELPEIKRRFTKEDIEPHIEHKFDAINNIKLLKNTPILFIQGKEDLTTSIEHGYRLAEVAEQNDIKYQKIWVDGADHSEVPPEKWVGHTKEIYKKIKESQR